MAMIPCSQRTMNTMNTRQAPSLGFFTIRNLIGEVRGAVPFGRNRAGQRLQPYVGPLPAVTASFRPGSSQIIQFKTSEWPVILEKLQPALKDAIDSFVDFLDSDGVVPNI